ncbi:MAG: hypothetical protein K9L85_01725 [Candidatus Peribacteraceae bacterium]|nr:hypothetical protein [Candidatus Peribacteraceae bacterium]
MFTQKENLVNRLIWFSLEGGPKPLPTPETSAEKLPPTGEALAKQKPPDKKIPQKPEDEPGHTQDLAKAEQKLDAAYQNPDSQESREIPDQLKNMSRAQIRNLERTNPEVLLKTCFWKIEEGDKLTPIANTGELKVGDKLRFNIPEANGKNKHLEMGAGLRVLPGNIKAVEINGEKFFRISDGGPFVDKNGDYRAIRSHENETITLVEPSAEDKKTAEGLQKTRGQEYARRDVGSALEGFLAKTGQKLTSENIDKFLADLKNDPTATPEMLTAAKQDADSLKKFAEIWSGFNLANYKNRIAGIESRGSGDYSADNQGRGASDAWNKRALGKYQFTIETLRGFGVNITDESEIAQFKNNPDLQEKIMNEFTENHLNLIRDNPNVVAQIAGGKYSVDQVLAAMHLGGAGALRKVEREQLSGTDYFGTSFAQYMDKMKS